MLLHRKGKLTIAKSKSSRLSYSEVVSLPLESILSKISRYEADSVETSPLPVKGRKNLGLCSALSAFEQGGIFIVPHLL
jgi:hypothetical protein